MTGELVRYDAMLYAIAECHSVDEVADLRNKARALEIYAKQAMNLDAERQAREVRLRAERRSGELLAELPRGETSKGGNTGGNQHVAASKPETPPSPYAEALTRTGISRQSAVDLELGRKLPGLRLRLILARRLQVTPEAIDAACRESCRNPPFPHSHQPAKTAKESL